MNLLASLPLSLEKIISMKTGAMAITSIKFENDQKKRLNCFKDVEWAKHLKSNSPVKINKVITSNVFQNGNIGALWNWGRESKITPIEDTITMKAIKRANATAPLELFGSSRNTCNLRRKPIRTSFALKFLGLTISVWGWVRVLWTKVVE